MRYAALLALAAGSLEAERANPIRRVVTMLQNMQTKVREEGEVEEDLYKKFMCFCDGNTKGMTDKSKAAKAAVVELTSQIQEETARKAQTDQEITEHQKDRAEAKKAINEATVIRDKEREEYEKTAGDTKDNVDSLARAISALERGLGLLQSGHPSEDIARLRKMALISQSLSSFEKESLSAFLSNPYGEYHSSSGEIVGILKQMKDTMEADLKDAVGKEEEAIAAFTR